MGGVYSWPPFRGASAAGTLPSPAARAGLRVWTRVWFRPWFLWFRVWFTVWFGFGLGLGLQGLGFGLAGVCRGAAWAPAPPELAAGELQLPRTAIVGCCAMRAAMALCAWDGSGLAAASVAGRLRAASAPPFCDGSALAAAAPPFRAEGSDRLLRRGSGSTLLPLGRPLRCSKPVFDAGGIGATLPFLGCLGLVLAISSDTHARRALRPDSCISSAKEDGTDQRRIALRQTPKRTPNTARPFRSTLLEISLWVKQPLFWHPCFAS